jgi:apolipoprotein N-acyltransferase
MIDPYAWGYGSIPFLIGVLFLALVFGLAGWTKGVWIIGAAIIAWSLHWHESSNLWDYLLDPLLAIWAVFAALSGVWRKRKEKARSGYLFRPG